MAQTGQNQRQAHVLYISPNLLKAREVQRHADSDANAKLMKVRRYITTSTVDGHRDAEWMLT